MPISEHGGSIGSRPQPVLDGRGEGEPLWPSVWLGLGLELAELLALAVGDEDRLAGWPGAPTVPAFLVVCPCPGVALLPTPPAAATLDGVVPGDAEGFVAAEGVVARCALGGSTGMCCPAVGAAWNTPLASSPAAPASTVADAAITTAVRRRDRRSGGTASAR
jgi:hypothetical protein